MFLSRKKHTWGSFKFKMFIHINFQISEKNAQIFPNKVSKIGFVVYTV